MLAFAHFFFGTLLGYYCIKKEKRNLLSFLIIGFMAISPDIDFIFGNNLILGHRHLTHSLIFTALYGIITLIIFRSFFAGALAQLSHRVLDFYPGWFNWINTLIPNNWYQFVEANTILISTIIGGICLLTIITIELHNKK